MWEWFESFKHLIGRQHTLFWHYMNWQSRTAGNRQIWKKLLLTKSAFDKWQISLLRDVPRPLRRFSRLQGPLTKWRSPYTPHSDSCKVASSMETVWLRLFIKSFQSQKNNSFQVWTTFEDLKSGVFLHLLDHLLIYVVTSKWLISGKKNSKCERLCWYLISS